jgi:hypothetical protein
MSLLVQWWLRGQWARATHADAVARMDACLAMLGLAAALLLL